MISTCPICNSCSPIQGDKFQTSIIIGKYAELNINISHYFLGLDSIMLLSCQNTSTRFFFPATLAGDSAFYEFLQQTLGSQLYYPENKWEHQKAIDFVNSNKLKSVLDIGAGSGSFLEKLPDDILKHAIEFNEQAIEILNNKNLINFNINIEEFAKNDSNKGKYDLITAFQLLEHLPDVFQFVNAMIKCLKPGGYIIFGTPNNVPYLYGYEKYHTLNLPPHHMNLFNAKSFKKLELIFPIKLIKIDIEKFNLEYFLRFLQYGCKFYLGFKFGEMVFFKIIHPLSNFFYQFSSLFKNRSRNITVIYKKSSNG